MPNFRLFSAEETARRLDVYLTQTIPGLSRRRARQLCENSQVKVNGNRARPGWALNVGDRIEIAEGFERPVTARPDLARELGAKPEVIYEDEALLAVVKPRAQHTVTLRSEDALTLADVISAYAPECLSASPDVREAGLVQRLDYYTSGVVLAAKTRSAWRSLRQMMLKGEIEKIYLALVEGIPSKESFSVAFSLCQSSDPARMELAELGAKAGTKVFPCNTEVKMLRVIDLPGQQTASLVRAISSRVHRHQIRLHLAAVGHPLCGDEHYGSLTSFLTLPNTETLPGFFLHAEKVSLNHPLSGETLSVFSPQSVFSD